MTITRFIRPVLLAAILVQHTHAFASFPPPPSQASAMNKPFSLTTTTAAGGSGGSRSIPKKPLSSRLDMASTVIPSAPSQSQETLPTIVEEEMPVETPPPPPDMSYQLPSLQRLRRRLDTAEDKFDIHKISSAVFVLSSTTILLTGMVQGFDHAPQFLEGITWAFTLSCIVQCITSLQMNDKYRKNDPETQHGFEYMAYTMAVAGWGTMYFSPFAPTEIFDNFWIGNGVSAALLAKIQFGDLMGFLNLSQGMAARALRKKEKGGDPLGALGDVGSMGVSMLTAAILPAIGLALTLTHDRQWYFHAFDCGAAFPIHSYYGCILTAISTAYPALAITLRDKKLIPKVAEQGIIFGSIAPLIVYSMSTLSLIGGIDGVRAAFDF